MDDEVKAIPVRPPGGRKIGALTVPVAKAAGPVADRPCVWVLPHRPESARAARRISALNLLGCGADQDTVDRAELVVSELVTNAVEHALPPVILYLEAVNGPAGPDAGAQSLHIEVTDGGAAALDGEWTTSCTPDEHGRGSDIIDAVASARGTRTLDRGATRWVDLPTEPGEP